MKKLTTLLCLLLILASSGTASAVIYENYEGFQRVREGQAFYFYFDLVLENPGWTNSSLELMNDEAIGFDNVPLKSAFVDIDLFSVDCAWEKAKIKLFAFDDFSTYTLYDNDFNGDRQEGDMTLNLSFDISDTSFLNDPWGLVGIKASVSWWDGNWNDFAITKVAIGGESGRAPIPEPATMLLLGTGLIGLTGLGRKKLK